MPNDLYHPYMRIVDFFDKDETAGSFLSEDGDGGFTGAIYRMAREIDRLRALSAQDGAVGARAKWCGDGKILPHGETVEILAVDPLDPNVPARRACWVRWWPEQRDFPHYRSCDLSDLDLSDEGLDRLTSPSPAQEAGGEANAEGGEQSAIVRLLAYGERYHDGENHGTLFKFADGNRFFLADVDAHPAPQPSGPVEAQLSPVWLQNLIGFLDGVFPDDAAWRAIWLKQLRALALTAGKPEQAVPSGWQPIETAPKDGTVILLAGGVDGEAEYARDHELDLVTSPCRAHWSVNGWLMTIAEGGFVRIDYLHPTHWMPLPLPPKELDHE